MSVFVGGEPRPGGRFTISQLLHATKLKLHDSTFDGRVTTTMNQVEVDLLEKDALEVLRLVRSIKNTFAPINRIPGEVLSLVPNYWERCPTGWDEDEDLIALTHVCRGWRKLFTSRPSLWTCLCLANADKTQAYIERAGSLPLEVAILKTEDKSFVEDALLLAIPHTKRFKSLTICGNLDPFENLTGHLTLPTHFLRELIINIYCRPAIAIDTVLCNWDLSPVRSLSLGGVITSLPWKNLWNLTEFVLYCAQHPELTATRLLSFLESAPQLRDIALHNSVPAPSNASPRVVPLPHLKNLTILGDPGAGILDHLSIPEGASLALNIHLRNDGYLFPDCLPKSAKNLKNLFPVTIVNLDFREGGKVVHLLGPSGELRVFGSLAIRDETNLPRNQDCQILRSLDRFSLHTVQSLSISGYKDTKEVETIKSSPYHILLRAEGLHTLMLRKCRNLPFILSLNPNRIPSNITLCPNLEELILHVETRDAFCISHLVKMTKQRASRGAKLRSIMILGLGELLPAKEVFRLREYVTNVEYRTGEDPPEWDSVS